MANVTNRGKSLPRFPASVFTSGFTTIGRSGLTYTFGADFRILGSANLTDPALVILAVQDTTTGAFGKATLADLTATSQPLNPNLTAFAGLTLAANKLPYATGPGALALADFTPFWRTVLDDADAATSRATLGVAIGSDVQAYDVDLAAYAALSGTGLVARTGAGTAATRSIAGSTGRISISNGDGVSGNPTVDWDGVQVRKNSTGSTFTRRRVNLIEGTGISLTVADDSGSDEVDVTVAVAASGSLPVGYLNGFLQSNNTTDATNDIDVASGSAKASNGVDDLTTTQTIVKQIDVAFAEYSSPGTASGGRDSADNLTIAKTFHIHMIGGSGKNTQPFFSTSLAPTLPSGFTFRRRVGSLYWTGSAIKAFVQVGQSEWLWTTPVLDVNTSAASTSGTTASLTLPSGIRARSRLNVRVFCAASAGNVYLSTPDQSNDTPSGTAAPLGFGGNTNFVYQIQATVVTNTSAQIRYRALNASTELLIATLGWVDLSL